MAVLEDGNRWKTVAFVIILNDLTSHQICILLLWKRIRRENQDSYDYLVNPNKQNAQI